MFDHEIEGASGLPAHKTSDELPEPKGMPRGTRSGLAGMSPALRAICRHTRVRMCSAWPAGNAAVRSAYLGDADA